MYFLNCIVVAAALSISTLASQELHLQLPLLTVTVIEMIHHSHAQMFCIRQSQSFFKVKAHILSNQQRSEEHVFLLNNLLKPNWFYDSSKIARSTSSTKFNSV